MKINSYIYYILVIKCVNFIKKKKNNKQKQKQKNYINVLTYFFLFLSFCYFFLNTFCKNNIFFYLQINFEEVYDLYKYKLKLLKTSSSGSG